MDDGAPLATSTSTPPPPIVRVRAAPRLVGGGGDGGSTCAESRSCFLEMYAGKKPDKVDPAEESLARATRCALTGEPLRAPVVADALGALMNKEAVVGALLSGALPDALAGHVTGLRSLADVRLGAAAPPREEGGGANEGGQVAAAAAAPPSPPAAAAAQDEPQPLPFACPVTGAPMNGRFRFYLHRPSGVAISERALREAPRALVAEALSIALDEEAEEEEATPAGGGGARRPLPPLAALQQQAAVGEGDFLPINPTGPELARLRAAVLARVAAERERKAARKQHKGSKKRAAGEEAKQGAAAEAAAAGGGGGEPEAAAKGSKKLRVPEGATPAVYASIFAKPGGAGEGAVKETFCARAMSGR